MPQLQKSRQIQLIFQLINFMNGSKLGLSAEEYLRQLAEDKPGSQEISLQFMTITDLMPLRNLLQKFPKLRKLNLHGNRIRALPTDLSVLYNLQEIDISNNLLDDNIEMTLVSLKTLPKLKKLTYKVKQEHQSRIAQELRSLEFLNNTKIIRQKIEKEYEFKIATQKSLSDFEEVIISHFKELIDYEQKYLGEKNDNQAELSKFKRELDQISRECLEKLTMSKQRATQSLENVMLYTTKFQMYELLKARCLNICMDIYSDIGRFMKTVLEDEDRLFKSVAQLTLSLARIELDQKEKEDEERYNNEFQSQHSIVNKNAIMQKELKRMRKQKDDLIGEISHLESHNKKLTDTIMKYTKGQGLSAKALPLLQTFQSGNSQQGRQQTFMGQSGRNIERMRGTVSQMTKMSRQVSNIYANNASYSSNKSLTLKQLRDLIEEIYESKLKFDEKNYQGKLARETMNQYLFTYLNQKYGLKSLTIEAASNIVSGIQEYSSRDNDVAVFGKILRNEVDEQFRFVQSELKTTIQDLLKMHIKSKLPYKSSTQINEVMKKKINGEISYQECEDIIKYLYDKTDASEIMLKLEPGFIEKQKKDEGQTKRRNRDEGLPSGRGKIDYSTFMQVVLNFQLKNHQKLLRPLVNAFKLKDKDSDGIVGQDEFIAIIQLLVEDAGSLSATMLDIVDPYETKVITFTQMVRLVANYPEDKPILNRYSQKQNEQGST